MKIFLKYILEHIKTFLFFLLVCLVFLLTLFMFELPSAAVLYAFIISAFFGAVIVVLDFIKYYAKHKKLSNIRNEICFALENLPNSNLLIENDYQELIRTLFDAKLLLENQTGKRYRELTDYYTIWAHQIKTPIAAMRLNLQSEDTPQNRELSEDLQKIEQYVEMVLCYLRLDSDTNDFLLKEYDLDSVIRQAVKKFSMQFIRRKISLEYSTIECKVLTDEKWLLFVIEQVLSNSLKYTKKGSIMIYLELPKTLCIKDTGIGISPEDLPLVFEKGYTGCNGRSDKKASGIGLYLCRKICNKLGHKITAQCEVGEGTVIKIDLQSENVEIE